jgi:hypothetical protein
MSTLGAMLLCAALSSVRILYFSLCFVAQSHSVVANEGQRIDIPDGCILENRTSSTNIQAVFTYSFAGLLSGNLNMIVRRLPRSLPPLS